MIIMMCDGWLSSYDDAFLYVTWVSMIITDYFSMTLIADEATLHNQSNVVHFISTWVGGCAPQPSR